GHGREAFRSAHIEPMPDLLDPHLALRRGHSDRCERRRELGTREPNERRLRGRNIALERPLLDEVTSRRGGGAVGGGDRSSHRFPWAFAVERPLSIDGVLAPIR